MQAENTAQRPGFGCAKQRNKWLLFPRPVAWLVLSISLIATAGGWFIARQHGQLVASRRFEGEMARIISALQERMGIYEDVLHGAVGLHAASYSVERAEWRAYLDSVSIERRFPGIDGVGFIAYVLKTNLSTFLRDTRADKTPDFELKEAGTGEDLLVVKYIEPEGRLKALLGRDFGVDAARRAVAEQACARDRAALSGIVSLQEDGGSPEAGCLMLLPVYRHGARRDTAEARRAAIEGWVFARFITDHLVQAVLNAAASECHLRIVDADSPEGKNLVFDSDPESTRSLQQREPLFQRDTPVDLGGRTWRFSFSTKSSFERTHRRSVSLWAAGIGGVFSVLLFGIAWSLSHTRERALTMASEMTSALRETNDQLESEIRERKRSAEALKQSEALYHSLVESLPLGVARVDLEERYVFVNRRFCADHRKSLDEIVGKTDRDLFPGDLAERRQAADRKALESGATIETVEQHPSFDGAGARYVQAIRTPVYDEAGKITGLLGIFWDVTDKRRAEAELEHERFLLRTLMDNVPERIYFKDQESRFLRSNRAHLRIFGLDRPEQAIGKSDFDFFSGEHARQAYADEQRVMAAGEALTREEKETWPDGSETWVLSTKMPLRDETGKTIGTFGISRDITDRKRVEDAMRLAKEAAEEASRIKSSFLASMSHELRTPLNSVIGFANILLKNKSGALEAAEINFLERILANGKHLLTLINEILDLSKIEARKTEVQVSSVALDRLVRETISQHESLVRDRSVQLLADLPERIAPMLTDADKLRQILINLIGNALKFTERGTVAVRVRTDQADRPVRIDVVDTGIGIPKDKLGVIFEAFQQAEDGTARKYGGTGLGLTISQALCRLLGFEIRVESELGRGSTFSVDLAPDSHSERPRSTAAIAGSQARGGPGPSGILKGKLVLVIDDELDSRTLLSHAIEEFGCQAITASSGEQGLRMAREFRPHLITVDLMMPQLDGWQVIQAIKADPDLCDTPVVVVSIVAAENRGKILGAVEVLQKPVARSELLSVLRRSLRCSNPRILIVDDEDDSRRMLAAHLETEKCEVRTAADGREAIDLMARFSPDLVLLDLLMPGMDGISFLNHLRSTPRFRFVPIVIVTAKDLTVAESQQLGRMAQEVVRKGDTLQTDLERVLHRFLEAQVPPWREGVHTEGKE